MNKFIFDIDGTHLRGKIDEQLRQYLLDILKDATIYILLQVVINLKQLNR